jgi:PEP-CTERM motif
MNKEKACFWCQIIRGGAFALGILWAQSGFAGLVIISMPSDPGQWLAYVDIGTGTGGTFDQQFLGGISTFGVSFPPDGAGHPRVPIGYPLNMAAFVDPLTGQLGVAGNNPLTGVTSGLARFEMNFQFAGSGTITSIVHFQGTVSAAGPNVPLNPTYGYLGEYVQLQDITQGSLPDIQGYSICSSSVSNCASVQPSISTDFQVSLPVQANHVYQLVVDTEGTAIGAASFDGIDPSSISIQLSPGLAFASVNGIALPGFLAPTDGGPTPPGGSVPEPTTLALLGLGLAGIMFARKRTAQTRSV